MVNYEQVVAELGRNVSVNIGNQRHTLRQVYNNQFLMREFVIKNPGEAIVVYNRDKGFGETRIGEIFFEIHKSNQNLSSTIEHLAQELGKNYMPISNHVKDEIEEFERNTFAKISEKKGFPFMNSKSVRMVRHYSKAKSRRR